MPCSLIEFNPPILAAPLWGCSVITLVMTAPAHVWAYYTRTRLLDRICSYCHWCLGMSYFAFYKNICLVINLASRNLCVRALSSQLAQFPRARKSMLLHFHTFPKQNRSFYKLSTSQKRRPTLLSLHQYPRIKTRTSESVELDTAGFSVFPNVTHTHQLIAESGVNWIRCVCAWKNTKLCRSEGPPGTEFDISALNLQKGCLENVNALPRLSPFISLVYMLSCAIPVERLY